MEQDVLAVDIGVPNAVSHDDLMAFSDAGAYAESMAYRFGRG